MAAAMCVYLRETLIVYWFQMFMVPVQLIWKVHYIDYHLMLLILRLYQQNVAIFAAKNRYFFAAKKISVQKCFLLSNQLVLHPWVGRNIP